MKTVAIIGASNNRTKFGNKAMRAFLRQGYTVFPVNPKETKIEGLPTFRSVREVPVRPDKISVYLPPSLVQQVLPEIAARGCDELWLNPGTESEQVLAQAQQLGLNVIQACSILGVGDSPDISSRSNPKIPRLTVAGYNDSHGLLTSLTPSSC